jgi:hypothetical protein
MKCGIIFSLISWSKEGDSIDDRKVFASPEITAESVSHENHVKTSFDKKRTTCYDVASMSLTLNNSKFSVSTQVILWENMNIRIVAG